MTKQIKGYFTVVCSAAWPLDGARLQVALFDNLDLAAFTVYSKSSYFYVYSWN